MKEEEVNRVRRIRDFLSSHRGECYGELGDFKPCGKCEPCVMKEAIDKLSDIVDPKDIPVPNSLKRLDYEGGINREAFFLNAWQLENKRGSAGVSILECILKRRPSQSDAEVAATVIQWLGTNVGGAFMDHLIRERERCSQLLKQRRQEEQEERNRKKEPDEIEDFLDSLSVKELTESQKVRMKKLVDKFDPSDRNGA